MVTKPLAERLWSKVDKTSSKSGCWLWNGKLKKSGYGLIREGGGAGGKMILTHRVAWGLVNGKAPESLCVLHKCDVRHCVNPEHLFVGTRGDNAKDRDAKGRTAKGDVHYSRTNPEKMARGERHGSKTKPGHVLRGSQAPWSKLTEGQVLEIRHAWLNANTSQREIASKYGITQSTVSGIVYHKIWKHL